MINIALFYLLLVRLKGILMYTKTSQFYDAIYSFKDYADEVTKIRRFIKKHQQRKYKTLLDVACGTGKHVEYLQEYYTTQGLDLDEGMLAIAHERLPAIPFHHSSMIDFDLGQKFDVITCLFSSIGYVGPVANLNQTLRSMAHHVADDGLIIVEPWLSPEVFNVGSAHLLCVDEPHLKISRMGTSVLEDNVSAMEMHYLVAENKPDTFNPIHHFVEMHRLTLFTHEEYLQAFEAAGWHAIFDEKGITGRGLYIGQKL